jgi:hypothetical protein
VLPLAPTWRKWASTTAATYDPDVAVGQLDDDGYVTREVGKRW